MKNPLHYQISEYDCGPTSMLNAIIYLFDRDEIPPEVIRNTMLYCLDCYSKEGIPGKRGTSQGSQTHSANWKETSWPPWMYLFFPECLLCCSRPDSKAWYFGSPPAGSEVYIGPGSRINQALSHGGAAVVRLFLDEPHYVLLTGVKDGSILLFDPYYCDEPYEEKDILIDLEHPRAYNREVPFRYFNREEDVLYALGKVNAREAVLVYNEKTRVPVEEVIEYFI